MQAGTVFMGTKSNLVRLVTMKWCHISALHLSIDGRGKLSFAASLFVKPTDRTLEIVQLK